MAVRRAAPLAGGRHHPVWHEDDIVAVLACKLLDPVLSAVLDLLPSLLASRVTAADNVRCKLRDVCGVLSYVGLDLSNSSAHEF